MSRVKGTAISGRLEYARRRGGDAAVAEIVRELRDAESRESLADGRALKSAWYPFSVLVDIARGIDRLFGKGDLAIIEEVGGDVAENDLNGVYKLFMSVASPHHLLDKAASLWRNYYDTGEMVVIERTDTGAVLELRRFDTPDLAHCLGVLGWMIRTLSLCGCKNVVGDHTECRARGDARCIFRGSWD